MLQNTQISQRGGVLLFLVLALVAASCGTAATTDTAAEDDGPAAIAFIEEETTTTEARQFATITVAARNSIESSPLWIADSRGLFEKRGLKISFVPVTDEGAVIAALSFDESRAGLLGSTSLIEGLQNADRSLLTPIVYIDGTDVQSDRDRGSLSLIAPVGTGTLSGCDLEGSVVAVDSQRSISAIAVREMVSRDGCDESLVELRRLPPDDMIGALRGGVVDAAAMTDPLTARALRGPNELAANLDHELCPDYGRCPLSIAVFQADWAEDNPETVRAFRDAMHEAMTWIRLNHLDYLAELVACCALTPEDASGINVPIFVGDRRDLDSDMSRLQNIVTAQLERRDLAESIETTDDAAIGETTGDGTTAADG